MVFAFVAAAFTLIDGRIVLTEDSLPFSEFWKKLFVDAGQIPSKQELGMILICESATLFLGAIVSINSYFYVGGGYEMFEVLLTCTTEELYHNAEIFAENLTSEEMAREYIIRLFQRAPELTEEQEKKLHQLGRRVRKKFGMKPVRID